MSRSGDSEDIINIEELMRLTDRVKINVEQITFTRVTMTSDRFICLRHKLDEQTSEASTSSDSDKSKPGRCYATVVNLAAVLGHARSPPARCTTFYAIADSISMNPFNLSTNMIALKAGRRLQVFALENRRQLGRIRCNRSVKYWSWISDDTLCYVDSEEVHHWKIGDETSATHKLFDVAKKLQDCQLISYKTDPELQWLALTGLQEEDGYVLGITQLHSVSHSISQCIEAHVVCLLSYQFHGSKAPSVTLCAAVREISTEAKMKVYVLELGGVSNGNLAPALRSDTFRMACSTGTDVDRYDFPASMQVSCSGLIYIMSKYGQMYVCDMECATFLYTMKVSDSVVFTTVLNSSQEGIIGISRDGKVLNIKLNIAKLTKSLLRQGMRDQARRLSKVIKPAR